jgi:hypothetical protein
MPGWRNRDSEAVELPPRRGRIRVRFFKIAINPNPCPDGGIGRRAGLKIQWPVMAVPVRFRLRVL